MHFVRFRLLGDSSGRLRTKGRVRPLWDVCSWVLRTRLNILRPLQYTELQIRLVCLHGLTPPPLLLRYASRRASPTTFLEEDVRDERPAEGAGGAGGAVLSQRAQARLAEDVAAGMTHVRAEVHVQAHGAGVAVPVPRLLFLPTAAAGRVPRGALVAGKQTRRMQKVNVDKYSQLFMLGDDSTGTSVICLCFDIFVIVATPFPKGRVCMD